MERDSRPKKIVSYKNCTEEVLEAIKEKYPNGYGEYVIKVPKPNGESFYAITVDTPQTCYLVKVDVKIDDISTDDLDKDYDDDDIDGDSPDIAPEADTSLEDIEESEDDFEE